MSVAYNTGKTCGFAQLFLAIMIQDANRGNSHSRTISKRSVAKQACSCLTPHIAGGQSNEVSILVDLDGDSLPDKVWVNSSGTVMYRPNLNGPGSVQTGDSWFGEAQTITGIDSLGRSSDLRIDIHFEAYPVVAIQVGGGFGFSFGDRYFEDFNGDGRVAFIKPGSSGGHTVFYNNACFNPQI